MQLKVIPAVFVLMILCSVMVSRGHALEKVPRNTKEGFVVTNDGVRIYYFE